MALIVDSTGKTAVAPGKRGTQQYRYGVRQSVPKTPVPNQYGMYDSQDRFVSPGLRAPNGGNYSEWVSGSGVPDTSQGLMVKENGQWVPAAPNQTGSSYVGIPYGSSLYLEIQGKNGQTSTVRTKAGLEYNTYAAFNNFFSQSDSEIKKFQRQLVNLGYLTESDINGRWGQKSDPKTRAALAQLMYEGNLSGRAWFDVLTQGSAGTNPGGMGPGGRDYPYTTVQRNKTISTMQDARLVLRQTMQQLLGREPTDNEVKGFLKDLNQQERENPQVTRTTNVSVDESNTVNKGGFNPSAYAEDWTQDEFPGQYDKFQQNSYEDMALEAIRSL
jgi:hypothetical protein